MICSKFSELLLLFKVSVKFQGVLRSQAGSFTRTLLTGLSTELLSDEIENHPRNSGDCFSSRAASIPARG